MIVGSGGGGSRKRSRPRSRNIASAAAAGVSSGSQGAAAPPRSYTSPRTTSSGQYTGTGGSSGGSSFSRVSANLGGGGAPSSPPRQQQGRVERVGRPAIPNIQKYLAGDTTFNDQISLLQKQLENFLTSNKDQRADVHEDFRSTVDKMNEKKTGDLESLENDFAARGLLTSGLYTDAVGDYNQDYQTQLGDLSTSRQRSLSDLLETMRNYRTENKGMRTNARQDAIRRRAQQYGIKG